MTESEPDNAVLPVFDLGEIAPEDVSRLVSGVDDRFILVLPVPSIGSSNSRFDICDDLIEISWIAEQVARVSESVTAREDYDEARSQSRYRLSVNKPGTGFEAVIRKCATLLSREDEKSETSRALRYGDVRDEVLDYEDELASHLCRVPEILESYFANLVGGAYSEMRSEAPERYTDDIAKFPERRLEFWRSAFSSRIGAPCYTSCESWLVPVDVEPDMMFASTGQHYRTGDFIEGRVLTVADGSFVVADGVAMTFPIDQYLKSRVCASIVTLDVDESWPSEYFDWSGATIAQASRREAPAAAVPFSQRKHDPRTAPCLADPNGSLVIVNDGRFFHVLYGTKALPPTGLTRLYSALTDASDIVAKGLHGSPALACDWQSLTDEGFEQLCYDVILTVPRFDHGTIRKHGKSRSRDGGRDIEISDMPRPGEGRPRKWIFQCKLVSGKGSLSATKVVDIGDMLDHYQVGGYGVMASAPIDATLYDKLDAVCDRRGVEKMTFSVLELERALARNPVIRERYFGVRAQPG